MIDFNFTIDKRYLLIHALRQKLVPFSSWATFKDVIWGLNFDIYGFFIGQPEFIIGQISLSKFGLKIDKVLNDLMESKYFKRLYRETTLYKKFIEKQWLKNKSRVDIFLNQTLRVRIPKINFKVFLTHPKLLNGKYLGGARICLGHPEDWQNYSTVYLVHEALHEILKDRTHLVHAIIELIADNELRIVLNKKGKYFEFGGHPDLRKMEKILYPLWKKYLNETQENISDFLFFAKNLKSIKEIK